MSFFNVSAHFWLPMYFIGNANSSNSLRNFFGITTLSNKISWYKISYSSMKNTFNNFISLVSFFIFFIMCKRNLEISCVSFLWNFAKMFFFWGICFCNSCRSSIGASINKILRPCLYTYTKRKKLTKLGKNFCQFLSIFFLYPSLCLKFVYDSYIDIGWI